MTLTEQHPVKYLTPTRPAFWRWEGSTIIFAGGETLTFREELMAVIRHLQPFGLPPMESLLLFLAATRDHWEGANGLGAAWEASLRVYDPILLKRHFPEDWEKRLQENLNRIRTLESSWRREPAKKGLVAEVCFEKSESVMESAEVEAVIHLLERGFVPPTAPPEADPRYAVHHLAAGLRPLLGRLPVLSTERLELRRRTGLDAVGGSASDELPLPMQIRSLMSQLEGDPEWQGLAQVTKNLMAAVHVPRALGDPDELPLGGFSDICNRGPMDRLLTSELANDDLVLSVRVALNEALYLRRESPPRAPQNARLLLVDNGIRLWGLPRLFAAAVALAVAATTDPRTPMQVFVPTKKQPLRDVRVHTRDGLLEMLSHMHPHAHPGNALLDLKQRSRRAEEASDVILITHEDVLSDASFASVLALVPGKLFVATVNRRGCYALYQYSQEKLQKLQEASIDLSGLFQEAEVAADLTKAGVPANLPAIFYESVFPILLPLPALRDRTLFTKENGLLKISRDGRVLKFEDDRKGGLQVCQCLPAGKPVTVVEQSRLADDQHLAVVWNRNALRFHMIDVTLGGVESSPAVPCKSPPCQAIVKHGMTIVIHANKLSLHSLTSGEQLAELPLPTRVDRCYGDLILLRDQWHRVAVDGQRPHLELLKNEDVVASAALEEYRLPAAPRLRRRFIGVGVVSQWLILRSKRSPTKITISLAEASQELCFRPWPNPCELTFFERIAGPEGARYSLREAKLPGGSRAVLDSRGLLHLISVRDDLPEITLVLSADGPLSGWTSQGDLLGEPYFFQDPPVTPARVFTDVLIKFCLAESEAQLTTG